MSTQERLTVAINETPSLPAGGGLLPVAGWIAWGKKHRHPSPGQPPEIHPLLDHQIDVASVFVALCATAGVRRALEAAAGRPLQATDVERLGAIAFLHDIGKANTGFQGRYWEHAHTERPRYWTIPKEGHSAQGWALFTHSMAAAPRIRAGLPLLQMNTWGDTWALLHASISHHGRPVTDIASESIWQPVHDGQNLIYDPAETVAAMGHCMQRIFPRAFAEHAPELPDKPEFVHLFAGLVQLADWLGSDTREGFHPYTRPGEDRSVTAPERARHALRAVGLDVGDCAARVAATDFDFAQAFDVPTPRPMQLALADAGLGPVVVLEAETGSGKTEAALWRFLSLWRAGQVDALYFALPTRVAATQLYERVLAFVRRVWPRDRPVTVRALPGYPAADGQTATALPDFCVLWSDAPGADEAERRWAAESPKRCLAATIAVGTVDQALLSALQTRHAHLRLAMLARSLLVVDEVHASDAYMTRLLERLLRTHVAYGGQALLLSATLGASARSCYLAIGSGSRGAATLPSLDCALAKPYPAIGHGSAAGPVLRPVQGNPRHKLVHWQTLDLIDEPQRIATLAVQACAAGARVLVVRNTVPAAIATLRAVEALAAEQGLDCLFKLAGTSTLHHSRFSRQDRPLLDAEVQAQIGKRRAPRGGLVVIGTQTLEQSLDIDADLLITDLCPMDVLLQRLGRLHRHARPSADAPGEQRPTGFEEPRAWVLTLPGDDLAPLLQRQRHGLGPIQGEPMAGVYVDLRVLEATRRLIMAEPTRRIPADNRMLVERATHPEALTAITEEMGKSWEDFGNKYEGALTATKTMANLHALSVEQALEDMRFPDEGHIGSRIGAADRLVSFDPPVPGPFGQAVAQLAIRHHLLAHALPTEAQVEDLKLLDEGKGFSFHLGTAQYSYSRLGLERIATGSEK
ncbi:CRISPR-associated helicase Cas3' [Verminephrobacter aporrectodeae subsp. tuberculatae]|nr:CRISPR-associated helicase Cas3' [Verminephrobacter aporrectodeae subsp. tuberculatae]